MGGSGESVAVLSAPVFCGSSARSPGTGGVSSLPTLFQVQHSIRLESIDKIRDKSEESEDSSKTKVD